ncbi:alpha/beta fold hydrolase [Parasegetibacter sp. NRK P23]|uniref:alpha/beta fold hydrolase n=1 Tax=Parasegetibacter sp. NRK P23 TaxID=2942999 RepID=UPI0020441727|nr:alpha/beta hydrolase [Parasegetibacter sp. NRK P23]MCM5530503.1 alpha/beta hydrolase [Parasegetibacter sp. NRK P23]
MKPAVNNLQSISTPKSDFKILKSFFAALTLIAALFLSAPIFAQGKRIPASAGRAEFIEVEKGVNLHVTDIGEGDPIVLIHGWPLSDAMYEYQYQALSRKGFRVIGITLRGFGASDKPYGKYNFDVFSDDIKVVLEKLNIRNATLGGFSMGGAVVLHYITKYNAAHVKKLALFAAAAPSWKQRPGFPYGISDAGAEGLIKATMTARQDLIASFGASFPAKEGAISKNVEKWLENINLEASPYAITESITALRDLDLRPELSKINIPVAIFHGTQDKLCDFVFAEELNKGIPNSYIVKFENSGHALFVEEADKFNAELEKFAKQ